MKISATLLVGAALCAMVLSGCEEAIRQDMANQPKNRPESPSDFFADGRSVRPLIENTVARGSIDNDVYNVPKDFVGFPPAVRVNEKLLRRGEDRYKIFCTPCHGLQGDGQGMIAMRGMKHPPSFHLERLRSAQAPNGYFYDVMTNGFGAMYSYSERITPSDRWAIIAYVRALQLSRNVKVADLSPELRQKLDSEAAHAGGAKE
jgi:mono/diheme cytochrome c family protein